MGRVVLLFMRNDWKSIQYLKVSTLPKSVRVKMIKFCEIVFLICYTGLASNLPHMHTNSLKNTETVFKRFKIHQQKFY